MNKKKILLIQLLITALPLIYMLIIWNQIPDTVPIHFDEDFIADGFDSKWKLLMIIGFISTVTFMVSTAILNINKIDPKHKDITPGNTLIKLSWTLTFFLTVISSYAIRLSTSYNENMPTAESKFLFLVLALFFASLGNLFNNIKPNYFIGIRVPWTLENEDNWRKTHHLGAKLWFFGGLVLFALILFIPKAWVFTLFIGFVAILTIIPIAYSYWLYRQKLVD